MAVIKIDDCVKNKGRKMCRLQGIKLIFFVFIELIFNNGIVANPTSCDLINQDLKLMGLPSQDVLERPQNGLICGEGSCCSETLENNLLIYSETFLEKYMRDAIFKVSQLVETRARKFDDLFRTMMNQSKLEFHSMFEKTYGIVYLQNTDVFSDFFKELEDYYQRGSVRLSETMDSFFGILYQRMYMVLNGQYKFDDTYMSCVNNHMMEMKPFGDVPYKLTQQLKRAFIASRAFYKCMAQGADAIKEISYLHYDKNCLKQLTEMQSCGKCRGEWHEGACSNYCIDTIKLCLKNHLLLSDSWDNFINAIDKIAERLIGPFNIVHVVEPLNIKISEAVMNFQEASVNITDKIVAKCGTPKQFSTTTNSRNIKKREADFDHDNDDEDRINKNMEIRYDEENNKKHHKKAKKPQINDDDKDESPLEKLVKDIKLKIKSTKYFFAQLPFQYCNNASIVAAKPDSKCWNGTATAGSTATNIQENSTQQEEVNNNNKHVENVENSVITRKIHILDGLTDKLRKAYQGQDVDIIDDTEESFDGSGSGSGDDGYDDEEEEEKGTEEEVVPEIIPNNNNNDIDFKLNNNNNNNATLLITSSTEMPEVVLVNSGANNNNNQKKSISLTRALISYLLPMVMIWFGGAIKDML